MEVKVVCPRLRDTYVPAYAVASSFASPLLLSSSPDPTGDPRRAGDHNLRRAGGAGGGRGVAVCFAGYPVRTGEAPVCVSPNPLTRPSPNPEARDGAVGASVAASHSVSHKSREPAALPPRRLTLAVFLWPVAVAARRPSPAPSKTPCRPDLRYLGPW
ncbi:hypothetical protein ABZP36_034842 [Zizania latifolia]